MNKAELAQWKMNQVTKEVMGVFKRKILECQANSIQCLDFENSHKTQALLAFESGKVEGLKELFTIEASDEE